MDKLYIQECLLDIINTIGKENNCNFNFPKSRINSIDLIKIVVKIEGLFHINFNDEDLLPEKFNNLDNLVSYIYDKVTINNNGSVLNEKSPL